MIGGLLATIIASKKHRTGFATFSGILVALNVFLAIYTSSWDFWPFGWILFLISILMQKKVSKEQTIIINNMSPPQDSMTDARAKNIVQYKVCKRCGETMHMGNKYCPNCGTKSVESNVGD